MIRLGRGWRGGGWYDYELIAFGVPGKKASGHGYARIRIQTCFFHASLCVLRLGSDPDRQKMSLLLSRGTCLKCSWPTCWVEEGGVDVGRQHGTGNIQ